MNESIIVGMSGGVDSAVAAYQLIKLGYSVEAVFMKNWDEKDTQFCSVAEDYKDALRVCEKLDITLRTIDFTVQYWDNVFKNFLRECELGRTPNPDIMCNEKIKFHEFLNYCLELGAQKIATGHYAIINKINDRYQILRGTDISKDQSYFLYALNQNQISKSLFPVGNLKKQNLRRIAHEIGLHNYNKKDSTGICFIGERNYKQFLKKFLPPKPGLISTINNEIIGEHDGLMYYTHGQRQGIGIGGGFGKTNDPWYVLEKNIAENILIVGQGQKNPELYHNILIASNINWISGNFPKEVSQITAKIRYRGLDYNCDIEERDEKSIIVKFEEPQFAISPGQSIVFYDKEICLGGAIIDSRSRS